MKRIVSFILSLCLILSLVPSAFAARDEAQSAAERLHALGLLSGVGTLPDGSADFALADPLSREQGVIMLLRLMGRESESDNVELNIPFTDVSPWAARSVAYAHKLGLAKGYSETLFGGRDPLSAAGYLSFVLRALGYRDGEDFSWRSPWTLSDSIGLTRGEYGANSNSFTRGDMAIISARALDIPKKDGGSLLDGAASKAREAQSATERLHALGLLSGVGTLPNGSADFALSEPLSREQGVIMLLRLMGRESESDNIELSIPFTDVSPWAARSVAYAHKLGLAKGYSETLFGGRDPLSAAGYLSFVLRALGYRDGEDFSWRSPWTLSDSIGLTRGEYGTNSGSFTRGDMAIISARALDIPTKDGGSLLDKPLPVLPTDPAKSARIENNWDCLENNFSTFGYSGLFGALPQRQELEQLLNKPQTVSSLGELLGYLALSDFNLVSEGWVFREKGLEWQLPESADYALRGHSGSSAALAALASSLLGGSSEEVGFICFSHPAIMGGGHFLSYLRRDSLYYVFDLSAMVESAYSSPGTVCCGTELEETALRWLEENGSNAQHMFAAPGAPLPWACSGEELYLPENHREIIKLLYEDTDMGCNHRYADIGPELSAELELIASALPTPKSEKGSIFERSLSDEELAQLKYADKHSLRRHISSLPDAAAWLDSFIYEFSSVDKGLELDIDYLLSLHRLGFTAPELYSAFAFWCLGDDMADMELLLASADSPQGARLYSCLLIKSGSGYEITNPASFSAHPNPVYGFRENTVSGFQDLAADFIPRHDWAGQDSVFELYNILRISPAPEKGSFALEENFLHGENWAEEVYRK